MGGPRVAIQLVRRNFRWIDLVAREPIVAPPALLSIPGIRLVEPELGHPDPIWKLEVPSSTWMLPDVAQALQHFGHQSDASSVIVPTWPGLYNYQQDAVQWLTEKHGGLLALQLGLGKSRTSLVAARCMAARSGRPVLICGPKYVRSTWQREIRAVFGDEGYEFLALNSVTPTILMRRDAPLFIFCHYDIVHAWWSQIVALQPCVTILDEAHLIRNPRTRRGKAAALAVSTATARILLTGTPIQNRPSELYSLLNFATGMWSWGKPSDFRIRYTGASTGIHGLVDGEPTNVEELRARLSCCLYQRSAEDVGLELPPVTRDIIYVDPTSKEQEAYAELFDMYDPREALEAVLNSRASRSTTIWLDRLRKLAAEIKKETTLALLHDLAEQGEDVVVFSWQRVTAKRFGERAARVAGITKSPVGIVHGEMSAADREYAIDYFQANGGTLSATYGALSTGVTLDRARIVVLHDLDYVPSTVLQAEGRVTGGLRRRNKHCIAKWIVARGTLDELLVRTIGLKGNVIDTVLADQSAKQLGSFLGYKETNATLDKVLAWARGV